MKFQSIRRILGSVCLGLLACTWCTLTLAQETEMKTKETHPATQKLTFTDTGEALINPQMGWTMHFYSNVPTNYGSKLEPSDSLDWFEGCSTVFLRIPWAFLEPEEGKFNWAIVDTPAQRWIAKGKTDEVEIQKNTPLCGYTSSVTS